MEAHSNKPWTNLRGRRLWYDGDSTVSEETLYQYVAEQASTDGLFVDEMSDAIRQYNTLVPKERQISIKKSVKDHQIKWVIPTQWLEIDVRDYVENKLIEILEAHDWDDGEIRTRVMRTKEELDLYQAAGLNDVLRALIYIINTLQSNGIVWGVGRGSSVASYVLFLIGVHDVDSVQYELDITDFIRPE